MIKNASQTMMLSGPTAAGKNSVANHYAMKVEKSAVVDYDVFHNMLINPHLAPWEGLRGLKQQEFGIRAVANCANIFNEQGFNVIILDVITSSTLKIYKEFLKARDFKIIQLLPNFEVTKARFLARGRCLTDLEFENVYKGQVAFNEYNLRIDNSSLDVHDTCYQISKYMNDIVE